MFILLVFGLKICRKDTEVSQLIDENACAACGVELTTSVILNPPAIKADTNAK
jgi:hypothetical protein